MSGLSKLTVEERKRLWEDVKFRLEYAGWYKKSQLRIFEAYFVRGRQPKLHPLEDDPIPFVYRLWLSPDQSIEAWLEIADNFLAGPALWETDVKIEPSEGDNGISWKGLHGSSVLGAPQISRSLRDSYEILTQLAASRSFHGGEPVVGSDVAPPLGYMGGAEKRLYDFMTGRLPGSERLFYEGKRLFSPSGRLAACYEDLCIWLDARLPCNPYSIVYYMGDVWVDSLTDKYMAELSVDEGARFYLDCYLKMIARYSDSDDLGERGLYCKAIRTLLDEKFLSEPMNSLWCEAKKYKGRIDLNFYMGLEPYYVGG